MSGSMSRPPRAGRPRRSAAAQLVLDGAQQVVGLVRDREVGVARHPEEVVPQDLHAGEELVEVPRDHRLERDERVLADRHEARQHLLRHLHAREGLDARTPGRAARRRSRATGSRCRGTDAPGRRRAASAPGRSARRRSCRSPRLLARCSPRRRRCGCRARRAPGGPRPRTRAMARRRARASRSAMRSIVSRGGEPVGPAGVDPGVDLVVQARDAHHEELVEVRGVDREELDALEQRRRLVLGQLEHAVVEVEPGQLAVHVQLGRVELRRCRLGAVTASMALLIYGARP